MNWQRQLSSYSRCAFTSVKHNQSRALLIVVGVVIIAFASRDLLVVFVSGYEWKSGTGFAGNTSLKSYLYFSIKETGITGTEFVALLLRGLIGGGPKTILVLGNSISISSLLIKLLTSTNSNQPSLSITVVVTGIVTFLLAGFFHVLFAKIMYKLVISNLENVC